MAFKQIVAIIPARGGSKGILKKNIHPFAGRPLVAHTITQAVNSGHIHKTFVSTDDNEIAAVAIEYGAEVIVRPQQISGDTASSESALLHSLEFIKSEYQLKPDYVVFLQCTSPLRKKHDIDLAIEQILRENSDSLLTAVKSHRFYWRKTAGYVNSLNYDYKNRPRRQDFADHYAENGSFYIFKPEILKNENNRLGGKIAIYEMEEWQLHEIDSISDFKLCEWLYHEHLSDEVVKIVKEDWQLIVYDFDGVMTDNRAYVGQNGMELVVVNRSDGLAVSQLKKVKIPQIILSTETNPVVQRRAEKLGIPVYFGIGNKKDFLQKYALENNINLSKVIYIGNDVNDLEAMQIVGFPITPADGHARVKRIAKYTTQARGGEGVVRELLDLIN